MNKKYDYNDFQNIVDKKATFEEIATKYNCSVDLIHRAMNKAGYYISKRQIVITSPRIKKTCNSIQEVARELGISHTSVIKALKGERVKILEDLKIKLEEIKNA